MNAIQRFIRNQKKQLILDFQEYYQSDKFDDERSFEWNIGEFLNHQKQ